jgi:hypothetical protein
VFSRGVPRVFEERRPCRTSAATSELHGDALARPGCRVRAGRIGWMRATMARCVAVRFERDGQDAQTSSSTAPHWIRYEPEGAIT